jgi:phage-related tail fiber protein
LECDGALVSRAAYPALCAAVREAQVVELEVLNPGGYMHVLWPAHGLAMGTRLTFSTAPGGTLPPGLAADTVYQISHQPGYGADAFCLSAVDTGVYVLYTAPGVGALTATAYPFGAGDGSTTFALPDLRGEFIRGWDHGRGIDVDRCQGTHQAEAVGPHEHPITGDTSGGDNPWGGIERKVCTDDGGVSEGTESGTMAHLQAANPVGCETRPRNVALLYIIKT